MSAISGSSATLLDLGHLVSVEPNRSLNLVHKIPQDPAKSLENLLRLRVLRRLALEPFSLGERQAEAATQGPSDLIP